jgi:hypothetical protein
LLEGRGILISSLSKTVAAGLRLGWIAARPQLEQIDPHAQATHWPVSPLSLHMPASGLPTAPPHGGWPGKGRRSASAGAWRGRYWVITWWPGQCLHRMPGSPPLAMPKRWWGAAARGVEVVPASVFAIGTQTLQAVRISLSAAQRAQLKQGLEIVARVMAEQG